MKLIIILNLLIIKVSSREIEIETFTPDSKVDSKDFIDYGSLRVTKIKRNEFAVSGDFELKSNCGDEKNMVFEIRDRNNGNLIKKSSDKFCKLIQEDQMIVPDLFNETISNFTQDKPCPFPKGKYSIKKFIVDESRFKFVPMGNYKARFIVTENDKILAAAEIEATMR